MVCSNIDDSMLPKEERISNYIKKSFTINLNNRTIGIIGYLTPDTKGKYGKNLKIQKLCNEMKNT